MEPTLPPKPAQPQRMDDVQPPVLSPLQNTPTMPPQGPQLLPTAPSLGPAPSKPRVPVLAIIVASVVALSLIALTLFVYLQGKNKTTPLQTENTSQASTDPNRVSPDDVEATSKQIDQNLNTVNDSADFTTSDLSDPTLGL